MSQGAQFVVMGVTSCGKSAVAEALADALKAPYIEGDALHGDHNIAKMSRGERLILESGGSGGRYASKMDNIGTSETG